jgi:hypothetical protein
MRRDRCKIAIVKIVILGNPIIRNESPVPFVRVVRSQLQVGWTLK